MSLPDYRYFTTDLLSGAVLGELPFYGVYCSRQLSEAGSFNATFKLGSGRHVDTDMLAATIPGKTAVYVQRDGVLVWGGIIWSRTYAAESQTAQLTGQTFESIFDHVIMESNFIMQSVEQSTIMKDLIDTIQAQEGNNFNLTGTGSFPTTGIPRTVLVPGYEYHFANDIITQIVGVEQGIEYTIDVIASGTIDQPTKVVRVGFPMLGTRAPSSPLVYDYPGTVSNYWWPESSTRGATKVAALGKGSSGPTTVRAEAVDGNMLAAGWPAFWQVNSYSTIADLDGISSKAHADLEKFRMPYSRPTIELKSDVGVGFSGWNEIGSDITLHIEDSRFPNGFNTTTRMIGWEFSPGDSDTSEVVKLTIEGADE